MHHKSFSNRIALRFLYTTAFVTIVLFAIIYIVVRQTVYSRLDEDLKAESSELYNSLVILKDEIIISNPYEWQEPEHGNVEVNPVFIQVIDSAGQTMKRSNNLKGENLMYDTAGSGKIFSNSHLSGKSIREFQVPLINQNNRVLAYLLIALPLDDTKLVMSNLLWTLILSFPVLLLMLFVVTRYMAQKSMEPVIQIINKAGQITHENLNDRIPVPETEDEIRALSNSINKLLDRLEDAIIREQQFTSDASHELRTPLSVIKGTLEILIRKPRSIPYYEEKIKYCLTEVDRMSSLVDQLLLLARYEDNKLNIHWQETEITELLDSIIDHAESLIKEKNISIIREFGAVKTIKTDPEMIGLIIENILTNSLKYSDRSGSVIISIQPDHKVVNCRITDTGIGLSEDEIGRVFQRFYRAETSRNSRTPGYGLGLAIVKKLSDLLNISVDIKSRKGEGTEITLAIPINF